MVVMAAAVVVMGFLSFFFLFSFFFSYTFLRVTSFSNPFRGVATPGDCASVRRARQPCGTSVFDLVFTTTTRLKLVRRPTGSDRTWRGSRPGSKT
jgi:hypothetical protein